MAATLITPQKHYQKTSGLRSLSNSIVTILNPMLATSLYAFAGIEAVIYVDLATFALAFWVLLVFIRIPPIMRKEEAEGESFLSAAGSGLKYLREQPLILLLILFLAGVNFVASAFDAVLPALVLPSPNGGSTVLGLVSSFAGFATLAGSLAATLLPAPANRIRVIYLTMLISLGTENFLLAFARQPFFWCLGQVIGWLPVPLMSANLDVILRSTIPASLQGRVYSCRNTLQFFTIPLGLLFGGFMVDQVCEPFMAAVPSTSLAAALFGTGKGSGAALMMFLLGVLGTAVCLIFRKLLRKYSTNEQAVG